MEGHGESCFFVWVSAVPNADSPAETLIWEVKDASHYFQSSSRADSAVRARRVHFRRGEEFARASQGFWEDNTDEGYKRDALWSQALQPVSPRATVRGWRCGFGLDSRNDF